MLRGAADRVRDTKTVGAPLLIILVPVSLDNERDQVWHLNIKNYVQPRTKRARISEFSVIERAADESFLFCLDSTVFHNML